MAGTYTAARTKPKTRALIIAMLSQGEPICRIEQASGVSEHIVRTVREQESSEISQRKQLILAQVSQAAMEAWDQINTKLVQDRGKIPLNQLIPTAGTATDKIPILSNDPQQINVTHSIEPGPNVFQRLEQLAQRLAPPPQPKTVQATVIDNYTADSGNGTDLPATRTGANSRAQP